MIKVLFLVMEFPPVNTTGMFRSLKFIKYLRQFGIEPIVVTLDIESSLKVFKRNLDNELLNDVPEDTKIYRIACEDPAKYYSGKIRTFFTIYFSIEDMIAKWWRKNLRRELPSIIAENSPQIIYTSLPPYSSGRLAVNISKKYNLPLILDMRDGWSKWTVGPYGSWIHYHLTYLREKRLFKKASIILSVTPQLIEVFKNTHSTLEAKKFQLLTNGYDNSSVNWVDRQYKTNDQNKEFIIGYVGSFYYSPEAREEMFKPWWEKRFHRKLQYTPIKEDWLYRSPYFFFKSLSILLSRRPDLKQKIKVKFVGDKPEWINKMVSEFDLANNIFFYGRVTYAESLKVQESFDAFLCTAVKVIGGEDYALPSKIFDYITFQKPLLGFVTPGACHEFIKKSGLGIICNPDNPNESSLILEELIDKGIHLKPNKTYLDSFQRENIAEKLANIIKDCIQKRT